MWLRIIGSPTAACQAVVISRGERIRTTSTFSDDGKRWMASRAARRGARPGAGGLIALEGEEERPQDVGVGAPLPVAQRREQTWLADGAWIATGRPPA